jgi:hypothetical protein
MLFYFFRCCLNRTGVLNRINNEQTYIHTFRDPMNMLEMVFHSLARLARLIKRQERLCWRPLTTVLNGLCA